MKTIYKSIALEAALLSVTLALQAEIQSEGETVTADVQASSLDRLKVTLVSPNVSGARDLVASGNAVIEGSEIAVNLENLAFGTHRLVVSARFGTQIRTLYALDISVPQAELPNETQEYEDAAIVVSTYGDGGGGGEFPTDYAKQGDDPTATLTATQAYAQQAATDAAAAKTAAQSITSLDSDINAGKTAIAAAVTAKGVPTSPMDTMLQMATNVTQITQAPISINGGEMYARQLYGSLTTPNYWNLYEVMAQLLSDGRLNNYGGILLAEYYKGYDSLALSGAGAGGAYVVSDVDSNGNFILYTDDTTHVWDTKDDGKGNRWVAYCFNDSGHDFDITDTNTSPRSIHIGRHVGTITSIVNGRISEIVVPDGNKLDDFKTGSFVQNFKGRVCFKNLQQHAAGILLTTGTGVETVFIQVDSIEDNCWLIKGSSSSVLSAAIIDIKTSNATAGSGGIFDNHNDALKYLTIQGLESGVISLMGSSGNSCSIDGLKRLNLLDMAGGTIAFEYMSSGQSNLSAVFVGYKKPNDKSKTISFAVRGSSNIPSITDIELEDGICKNLNFSLCVNLVEDGATNNITDHILKRLKQDEADCGDGVTITLGATNLAKLTSQESIDLLDALTNTYGYTFA